MDFYYLGWFGIVSIQNLYRSVAPSDTNGVRFTNA